MNARLHHAFSLLLCGPSFSGKAEIVSKLIQSWIIDQPIDDIVICCSGWQNAYETFRHRCRFVRGMIDPDDLDERVLHLVIVDDLQDTQNKRIEEFFVKKCHHRNTSCIYIRTYLVRGEDIEHALRMHVILSYSLQHEIVDRL